MLQENVASLKRGAEAFNRRDVEAMLQEVDADIEWRAAFLVTLGGETTMSRGHHGIRAMFRDMFDVLDEIHIDYSEIRDLDDRIFAIGHIHTRGKGSGAVTESPYFAVVHYKNAKAVRYLSYLDRNEAFQAAGLRE